MNRESQDQELLQFTKAHLDESVEHLDLSTLSRLGQARQKALRQQSPGMQWAWPAWGMATASIVVLASALWIKSPMDSPPFLVTEDLELLASSDSLEFYEDLEFYDWLAEHDQAT